MVKFKRICSRCGEFFQPIGTTSKFCEKCRKTLRAGSSRKTNKFKMREDSDKRKLILKNLKTKLYFEKNDKLQD